jgi:hypothetical protein
MPEIDINHFIAYLTYNNNRGELFYEPADAAYDINQKIGVEYSTDGMAVFYHRFATFGQKLAFYKALQEGLVKEFGHGFSVAFAPDSDCSDNFEMAHFCKFMKALDPSITTIIQGHGTNFIPADQKTKLESLTDTWKHEPYHSSPVLSNTGVKQAQDSIVALLPEGVDYLTASSYNNRGNPALIVRERLAIDPAAVPVEGPDEDYVRVKDDTVRRIQAIADKAFEKAMDPALKEQLEISAPRF